MGQMVIDVAIVQETLILRRVFRTGAATLKQLSSKINFGPELNIDLLLIVENSMIHDVFLQLCKQLNLESIFVSGHLFIMISQVGQICIYICRLINV